MAIQTVQPLADKAAERDEMPLALGERGDRLRVGQDLPARLTAADMMRAFGYGRTRFTALVRARQFDQFELLPRIGVRAWSGARVQRYLEGESTPRSSRRSFGRK